ncbi:hypothetical protein ACH414_28210 [Streptomyces sp. NPDC020422]|uniref:hypothetical protein n=1 Tax=Streptomyces sp. NPDC020422 TaxID=3365074 RepID=UPI0037B098DA
MFSDGPVVRLLDLAVSVRDSAGRLSLDTELRRYVRLVRGDALAQWNCSAYAAAGALDVAADGLAEAPAAFREKAARAAGDTDPAEFLRTLAKSLREQDRAGAAEFSELPLEGWEFLRTFPLLFGLDAILVDEPGPVGEAVRTLLGNEHPFCTELAAGYASEAQRARVLFPGPEGLRPRLSWATREALVSITTTVDDHMQREH